MVLNPEVHLYDNTRNAKGSHLLIMPFVLLCSQPSGMLDRVGQIANRNCLKPRIYYVTACIIVIKTTLFRLHGQRESIGMEIPIHKHILLLLTFR